MQIPVGAHPKFGLPYLEIYVELRDLPSGTFFSYFMVLIKSILRWARSNDLPWFPDTPYIGPTGPAMIPCRNCLGIFMRGECTSRCYTIVSISWPGTHAITSAYNINPTNGSTFRTWYDVCQKLFNGGHSACLLACCLELGSDHWCQYICTEH